MYCHLSLVRGGSPLNWIWLSIRTSASGEVLLLRELPEAVWDLRAGSGQQLAPE
jgi:hypothetical protein